MNEAIDIRVRRAISWREKADLARSHRDIDAEFIFLWISFNALYGTPRYLSAGKPSAGKGDEVSDFRHFIQEAEKVSPGSIKQALELCKDEIKIVCESPFLDIRCWRQWDSSRIRERQQRIGAARLVPSELHLEGLLVRIYTLRNQLLHGAATDKGRRNRESLKAAIPIMRAATKTFISIVEKYGTAIQGLDPIPFPPSLGESKQFNVPRITRK